MPKYQFTYEEGGKWYTVFIKEPSDVVARWVRDRKNWIELDKDTFKEILANPAKGSRSRTILPVGSTSAGLPVNIYAFTIKFPCGWIWDSFFRCFRHEHWARNPYRFSLYEEYEESEI